MGFSVITFLIPGYPLHALMAALFSRNLCLSDLTLVYNAVFAQDHHTLHIVIPRTKVEERQEKSGRVYAKGVSHGVSDFQNPIWY